MSDGLFAAEGSMWSVHRRIVSPAFSRQNVSRWMDALWNEAEHLVAVIKPSAEKGMPVDFAILSIEYTIRYNHSYTYRILAWTRLTRGIIELLGKWPSVSLTRKTEAATSTPCNLLRI